MRQCPLCKRGPRDGDPLTNVRVQGVDDFSDAYKTAIRVDLKPGLYTACADCVSDLKPKITARVNVEHGTSFEPATLPENYLA